MEKIVIALLAVLQSMAEWFGMSNQKTKYQTFTVTKANATPAGRYTDSVELDTEFEVCDGVQVKELGAGGVTFYNIGLEDKNNTYQSLTHKDDYITTTAVNPNERYKRISIPVIQGQKVDVKTEFDAVLGAELKYQIIFRLRKKNK